MKSDDDIVSLCQSRAVWSRWLIWIVAIQSSGYCLCFAHLYPRVPDGSTEPRSSVSSQTLIDHSPADSSSRNQKIIKPQFFESFRQERDNATLLDSSAAYLAKKGIADSNHLNENEAAGAPWGGSLPKSVLAREILPMMTKMQGLTDST